MTIDEIIKYVMTTPENPNPAVLGDMLNQLDNSGSSVDLDNYMRIVESEPSTEINFNEPTIITPNEEEDSLYADLSQIFSNNQNFIFIYNSSNLNPTKQAIIMHPEELWTEDMTMSFSGSGILHSSGGNNILVRVSFDDDS